MLKNNLHTERETHTKTQREVALALGITERQYHALENGTSNGSMNVWKKAREYFRKPIDYLLGLPPLGNGTEIT